MIRRLVSAAAAVTMALSLSLALSLAAGTVGCGRESGDSAQRSATRLPAPEDAIDQELMLALSIARNLHHKADVYVKEGKLDEAIAEVRAVLEVAFPKGAPEGEDVKLDARARLAMLLLSRGDTDAALKVVDDGLAAATRESFFVANLHTVQGNVYEMVADGMPKGPERDGVLRRAISALDRANEINTRIQIQLMEERQ